MTPDELDRILSSDDSVEPSPDFMRKVMESVRSAAAEPPPLRFPWFRFAMGLAGCLAAARSGMALLQGMKASLPPLASLSGAPEIGMGILAVVISLAVASVPRMVSRVEE
jgi:hypothetical protein